MSRPRRRQGDCGSALRGRVERCSTELNRQLLPEDVTAVAVVLNREHYCFVGR